MPSTALALTSQAPALTAERVRELLDYDPETGILRWRIKRKRVFAGDLAGSPTRLGYLLVQIDLVTYPVHRLIWLHVTGKWPEAEIDHRDLDKANNRWANLREATRSQNCANKRAFGELGVKGVSRERHKYRAHICKDRKVVCLGTFDTIAEASAAYQEAARRVHGEFACAS